MTKDETVQALKQELVDGLAVKIEIESGNLAVTNIGLDSTTYYQVLLLLAAAANSIGKAIEDQATAGDTAKFH